VVGDYWIVIRLPIGYRFTVNKYHHVEPDKMTGRYTVTRIFDTKMCNAVVVTLQKLPLYWDGTRLYRPTERGNKYIVGTMVL